MGAEKILVVDDEHEVLQLLKIELSGEGFQVFTASNGQEAVQKAQMVNPHLILMDIMLPDLSGGDVVKMLKDDTKTSDIPVVFLTALLTKRDHESNKLLNVNDQPYLSIAKPFTSEELLSKIQIALKGSKNKQK